MTDDCQAEVQRWCFAKDDDGHTFLIPAHMKAQFEELLYKDDDFEEFNDVFYQYGIGGGAEGYTFTDPQPRSK